MHITHHSHTIHYAARETYWQAVERGEWEPNSLDVLDAYIKPGKVFIDIGAWVGALSLYAAKLGAKVYASEPDVSAIGELIMNIVKNDFNDRINSYTIAISNSNELSDFNTMTPDGFGNSESSLIDRGIIGQSYKTRCATLENFLSTLHIPPSSICLIKIDTEGSELLIIPGAIGWLRKHKPPVYISFHPAWFPNGQQDCKMLVDMLWPVYNFISVQNLNNIYNYDDVLCALASTEQSFVLTPR